MTIYCIGWRLSSQWGGETLQKDNLGRDEPGVSWGTYFHSLQANSLLISVAYSYFLQEQAVKEAAAAAAKKAYEANFENCSEDMKAAKDLADAAAAAVAKSRKVSVFISLTFAIHLFIFVLLLIFLI